MSARLLLGLVAFLPLASCGQPKPESNPPPDQWTAVPAGQHTVDGVTQYGVWRINARTGELDFCSYAPQISVVTPPTCSSSVAGP